MSCIIFKKMCYSSKIKRVAMNLIKAICVIVTLVILLSVSVHAQTNGTKITGTDDENVLMIGIEGTSIPFVITDDISNEYNGFDIDFINAIAREAGYTKLIFKDMHFDELLPSVLTGQVDIALSMITITEERAMIVDFIGPYYETHLGLIINRIYINRIKRVEDLKGKKVCIKSGTTCENYASTIPSANLINYYSEKEVFDGLTKNECVAVITNEPVIQYFLHNYNDENKFMSLNTVLTPAKFGIMIAKGRTDAKSRLENAMRKVMATSYFQDMCDRWFGDR